MKQVGQFTQAVIDTLCLPVSAGTPIMLGESNVAHMRSRHLADYEKYGCDIELILLKPDYVGRNPADDSIEYVKEYHVDDEYVKVAVRISAKGVYFARSLYVLSHTRAANFIAKGTLRKVKEGCCDP